MHGVGSVTETKPGDSKVFPLLDKSGSSASAFVTKCLMSVVPKKPEDNIG